MEEFKSEDAVALAQERTKQVSTAGWTAGWSAFFLAIAIDQKPTWPAAFAIASIAVMVSVVCYGILGFSSSSSRR